MLEVIFNTNGVESSLHSSNNLSVLTEETNVASRLDIKVYPTDESFDNIFPDLTDVTAYDTTTNEVVFYGSVFTSKPRMDQNGSLYKEVTCVHLLQRLTTACVVGFEDASGNISTMVSRILDIYNQSASDKHKIYMGRCPISGHPEVVHITSATCFDAITQIVVTDAEWEFMPTYRDGKWYLDISEDFGEFSLNDIIVGVNMKDISQTIDVTNLYTRIIPIGGASYIRPDRVNPQMSTLHEPEGMPLTLYGRFKEPNKIYLENEELEKRYSPRAKVVQYDDIVATDDTDFDAAVDRLYERAKEDAKKLTDIEEAYEVNAFDLGRAGYAFEIIRLHRMYHIINNKLGIDTWLKVTSRKIDYSNPVNSDLTFGPIGKRAMGMLSKKGKSVDQRISEIGAASYTTTDKRMGGKSIRGATKTQYVSMESHDANTLYVVVPDVMTMASDSEIKGELYLGDIRIGGEGGGGVRVEYAALLNSDNFRDFAVTNEYMMNIGANAALYYGTAQSFVVVDGQYSLMLPNNATPLDIYNDLSRNKDNGVYKPLFDTAFNNADLLGNSCSFNIIYNNAKETKHVLTNTANMTARTGTNSCTLTLLTTLRDKDTDAVTTWTRTNGLDATLIEEFIIIPLFIGILSNTTFGTGSAPTPNGYAQCSNAYLIGVAKTVEGSSLRQSWGTYYPLFASNVISGIQRLIPNNYNTSAIPLRSMAEQYFDFGLIKRSEPVEQE